MSYFNLILNDTIYFTKNISLFLGYIALKAYQYLGSIAFYFLVSAYFIQKHYNPYDFSGQADTLGMIYWTIPAVLLCFYKPIKMYRDSLNKRYMEEE